MSCNPNLPGTVKLFGAAQEAEERGRSARRVVTGTGAYPGTCLEVFREW